MIDFYAVLTHGIPNEQAEGGAVYAMICGEIRITDDGGHLRPFTYKLVKGKGDTHNNLFTLAVAQPSSLCRMMTVAPWGPDKPAINDITIRVMVKAADGAQRTKVLRFA